MREELANLVRTSICANKLLKRAREDSGSEPSERRARPRRRPQLHPRVRVVPGACF